MLSISSFQQRESVEYCKEIKKKYTPLSLQNCINKLFTKKSP